LNADWQKISESVRVQLITAEDETYVLAKSNPRAEKEKAMRWRVIRGLMGDLIRLRRSLRNGRIKDPMILERRLGRLQERHPKAHVYVQIEVKDLQLSWKWNREKLKLAQARDGAYLLRTNLKETDPAKLWCQYIQLTEAEAAFRALKNDVAIRPIWHWVQKRVEAHVMVAFLGYALWITLKNKLRLFAQSLTPRQVLKGTSGNSEFLASDLTKR
jgi:transposase